MRNKAYTAGIDATPGLNQAGVSRVRCVFSDSGRQIRLDHEGPFGSCSEALPGAVTTPDANSSRGWQALTRAFQSCAAASRTAAADILHAMLPSDCRICGGPMLGFTPVRVCEACTERVRALAKDPEELLCARCGDALGMESARFAGAMGMTECTACRLARPPFSKAVSYCTYDDDIREMLHALKFGGLQRVAEHVLGEWMAAAVLKLEGAAATDLVIVPVPLYRDRERSRGFNQANLLARAAVKRLGTLRPWWTLRLQPEVLERVKDTRPLYALRPDQRRRGLRGAFRVGSVEKVRGREVVLIDDILTTGATARECAKVLVRAGATKVWVATVARAQPESLRAVEVNVARWDTAGSTSSSV